MKILLCILAVVAIAKVGNATISAQDAIQNGKKWLLSQRNSEWGWGTRAEAEVVMALQLVDNSWYDTKNPDTAVSVKQMNIDLLAALSRYTDLDHESWYGGKLAQYINALVATCQNPQDFYGHDLIQLLKKHMIGYPKHYFTQRFAYSWAILALCNANEYVKPDFLKELTSNAGTYEHGVDEAAMTAMAFACVGDQGDANASLNTAMGYILANKNNDGSFGNNYTTGLAVQAMLATNDGKYKTDIQNAMAHLLGSQGKDGSFSSLLAANHVLPALAKTSFAAIGSSRFACLNVTKPTKAPPRPLTNTVTIRILNKITNPQLDRTFTVRIANGSSLFDALKALEAQNNGFSFTYGTSTWGVFIKSIMGVKSSPVDKTYWKSLEGGQALSKGVSSYKPTDKSVVTFEFTSYGDGVVG